MWHWFSRHIGGKNTLDYLIKVKGISLPKAVEIITGYSEILPPIYVRNESVTHKTVNEMANVYGFNATQKEQLNELLSADKQKIWTDVLSGIINNTGDIVTVALSQIGNVGGQPYWSWYGFSSRVEWCACFVSWCANGCGYIENGIIPKYASCVNGVNWFKNRGQWQDNTYTPKSGDIIFFDWKNNDGLADRTGIVEKGDSKYIYTVEGNNGDSCKECKYKVNDKKNIRVWNTEILKH